MINFNTTLGDSCDFFNGKAHEKDIVDQGEFVVVNSKFVSSDGLIRKYSTKQMFPLYKGDIVMVMSDVPNGKALAKCYKIDQNRKYSLNQRICAIRTEQFDVDFLFYQLNRNSYFLEFNNGENQTNLRKGDILNCPLWRPSLEVQQQIVEILDQAFEKIDRAIANIEQNIKNAEELFQAKLNEVFSQKGEGWKKTRLSEITEVKDGTHDSPKYVPEGIPFVTQKNIIENKLVLENTKFITEEDHDKFYKRSNVTVNDLLIAMIGANRGSVCIVETDVVFSIKNVGLIKESENFLPKYLCYFLRSELAKNYIKNNSSGSAQGFIGLTKLRDFPIVTTELRNQKDVIKILTNIEEKCKVFKQKQMHKLTSVHELKKSLLEKAFKGELSENHLKVSY